MSLPTTQSQLGGGSPPGPLAGTLANGHTILSWRLVGDVSGRFFVPRYQRGYRWGSHEVRSLLDDVWASQGRRYSLQPVVVKRRAEEQWELVDGQQRLTTLYLVFLFLQRERLQNAPPPYSIEYETRPGSADYLQDLDPARRDVNIDFFHLSEAYECIRSWFEVFPAGVRRQHTANRFFGFLMESVGVIWYEAPEAVDSSTLFTRLNVGRIPLTDAELFKALLLSRSHGGSGTTDRAPEIAAQWDSIERDLNDPDVWAFVSDMPPQECPTRIALLLDTLAGGPRGRLRPKYHTFDVLRQRMEASSPQAVWDEVTRLHALVLGWYEDRDLYHKVGYLVAVKDDFRELVALAADRTKTAFVAILDDRIREKLDLLPSSVAGLSYHDADDRDAAERLLLLMNVETVRRLRNSSERYIFRLHREQGWSLEHIHAQHADELTKAEQWNAWVHLHREALATMPCDDQGRRDALVAQMDAVAGRVDRATFQELAREVTSVFSLADDGATAALHSMHSISNLALLSAQDNSALGNAVFEVKRRRVIERDRSGAYIPICTRQVFLKYYSDADVQQVHFWSTQDRECYLREMISPDRGIVFPYLKPEVQET